jgi:hypothetical protein
MMLMAPVAVDLSQEALRRLQCPAEQEGKNGLGNEINWLAGGLILNY